MDKITDCKILGKSETKFKTISKAYILEKKCTGGGGQASYNLPESFFNELIKKDILIESEPVKAKNNQQNKVFKINEKFKVVLSNTVLKLLKNPITEEKLPMFLVVEGNGNKPQIRPSAYAEYKKKGLYLEYNLDWFKELYDNNSEENVMIYTFENDTFIIDIEEKNHIENTTIENFENIDTKINKPHQIIFFGAPGTGKSYKLNKEAENFFNKNNISRVTLHPNYNYSNFIGTFKPFPKIKNDNETITYTYVPGILTKLLIRALNNPKEDFLLIIEEINRANTAAVFGDFFQLLDRDKNGNSEYDIVVSEDLKLLFSKNKISKNINTECLEDIQHDEISVAEENPPYNQTDFKLKIPSNFYIWATMNSADQGVMPLDTAFKRRWEFEYIGINDAYDKSKDENGKSEFDTYNFKVNENELANWNDFRIKINEILSKCHVPEDKLLGPYFISKSILESGDTDKIKNAIKNKVLMYLYEDAGKQHRRKIFKDGIWETYSKLCDAFDKNCEKIFKDEIELSKTPKEKTNKIIEQTNKVENQNQENEITENTDSNDE